MFQMAPYFHQSAPVPIGPWSKVLRYTGNKVPFGMQKRSVGNIGGGGRYSLNSVFQKSDSALSGILPPALGAW